MVLRFWMNNNDVLATENYDILSVTFELKKKNKNMRKITESSICDRGLRYFNVWCVRI